MEYGLQEALQYLIETGARNEKPEVIEICGKTYCTKKLERYDKRPKARPIVASSLTALVDYLRDNFHELRGRNMIIWIENPKTVHLLSELDEENEREELFTCRAEVSEFTFDRWYDQENFLINLQANFSPTPDLELIQKVSGNIEARTTANYGDDGTSQKVTVNAGIASKEDVIVPNPCLLAPYRTFQEVDQPASSFVFRIRDDGTPSFKLVAADNNVWKCEAISEIKVYLRAEIDKMRETIREFLENLITIIG